MPATVLTRKRAVLAGAAALAVGMLGACKSDQVLSVSTPDYLNTAAYATPAGIDPLRYGVISDFTYAYDGNTDAFTVVSGNLADEIFTTDTFDGRLTVNARKTYETNNEMESEYRKLQQAHLGATTAIITMNTAAPSLKWQKGEMYMLRGFTEVFLAEGWCSGTPFEEVAADGTQSYGQPNTTQQLFTRAIASFDSALTLADTSVRVKYGSEIGKARAMLALAKSPADYAAAAAVVSNVPLNFQLLTYHSTSASREQNGMYTGAAAGASRYSTITLEGQNGLNYLQTPPDPRMPWQPSKRIGFDGRSANLPIELKFGQTTSGIVADGIEAKLDVLESQLQAGTQAARDAVFAGLNALRAANSPAIAPLAGSAPTTQAAAVDQLFQERAYWGWLEGKRLGDLRRLVRNYGRDAETVFPTGNLPAPQQGTYGTQTSIIIPFNERNNPNYAAKALPTGCIDNTP